MAPDEMVIRMWLHGKPATTASAYRRDAMAYLACGRSLAETSLADLQAWDADMEAQGHRPTSRARRMVAIRGLFKFAAAEGIIPADPSVRLKPPQKVNGAIERIAPEADVILMIAAEPNPRCRAALRLLYLGGLRASELCGLRWSAMVPARRGGGGEARVVGKGNKPRTILLPADLWAELVALTPNATPGSPVIPARDGKPMNRIVKRAADRAGLDPAFSTHWIRHCTATHALNNGCAVQVVQARLGYASLETTTNYAHTRADQGMASFLKG
jgi:site-specific recombinase XerD